MWTILKQLLALELPVGHAKRTRWRMCDINIDSRPDDARAFRFGRKLRLADIVGPTRPSTPRGIFRPQALYTMVHSAKYGNAPMPHSIFFHGQYAIHGTTAVGTLGRPASHGCVRLSPGATPRPCSPWSGGKGRRSDRRST